MLLELDDLTKIDIQSMATNIYKSAQAAHDLLENLLTWSRLQREQIEYTPGPVDLHELAENSVALLADMALNKKIRLAQTIEAGLYAYADKYMVDTVIRNLTTNALKFTPVGGQVTISAHQNGSLSDQAGSTWIEVAITDTGIGMDQADLGKLFKIDVHHTTPGTAEETGTGLGLILCQEMVEKNGGRIWVESEKNKGTKVVFTVSARECPHLEIDSV
jgi:signal transduction histidine kinase